MKNDYPEDYKKIIQITYQFSYGWRRIHNPVTKEDIADNLTTTEFTIAMLANRGWTIRRCRLYDHDCSNRQTTFIICIQ